MNGRFNTVKLFLVPKEIYRLNATPAKFQQPTLGKEGTCENLRLPPECGDKCKGILQRTNPQVLVPDMGRHGCSTLPKGLPFPVLLFLFIFYQLGCFLFKSPTVAQQMDSSLTSWRERTFQGNSLLLPTLG